MINQMKKSVILSCIVKLNEVYGSLLQIMIERGKSERL